MREVVVQMCDVDDRWWWWKEHVPHGVHKLFPFGGASHQLGNGHAFVDRVSKVAREVL